MASLQEAALLRQALNAGSTPPEIVPAARDVVPAPSQIVSTSIALAGHRNARINARYRSVEAILLRGAVCGATKPQIVQRWLARQFATTLVLVALFVCACASAGNAATQRFAPSPEHPAVVHVGITVRNLIAVDEMKEAWQVAGLLEARWRDPRLQFPSKRRGALFRDLPDDLWKPDLEFANEVIPTHFRFVDFYVLPDGTIEYAQAFTATLSTSLDLRRFPFDSQALPLVVQATGDDLDRTILKPDRENITVPKRSYVGLSQWAPLSVSERTEPVAGSASRAAAVDFDLNVRRSPNAYVFKFIIPLLLLVIISWVTFWLSHEEFKTKDQLGSAVSTLLIIVAFNITASMLLPKTEYVTYIDALLFACFIFVMISIATVVGTHFVQIKRSQQAALRMRRVAGIALPVAFVLTQIVLFLEFHIGG